MKNILIALINPLKDFIVERLGENTTKANIASATLTGLATGLQFIDPVTGAIAGGLCLIQALVPDKTQKALEINKK